MLTIESLVDSFAVREISFAGPSCRHEDRTISSSRDRDAWRVVSEDSNRRFGLGAGEKR